MKIESFPKRFHLLWEMSLRISDEVKSLITDKLTIKNIGKKVDSLNAIQHQFCYTRWQLNFSF